MGVKTYFDVNLGKVNSTYGKMEVDVILLMLTPDTF